MFPRLLEHARREAEAGETFLEFRLDYLDNPARAPRPSATSWSSFPECIILATCRRHQNHGKFNGSIEDQLAHSRSGDSATARTPSMWRSKPPKWSPERLHQFRGRAQLIVSYHNFETTPPIDPVRQAHDAKVPADVYKIVTTARKPSDNVPRAGRGQGR